jgi:hypothetical protein
MATPRKKRKDASGNRGRKPPQRTGKPLNVWIASELRDALDAYVEGIRPKTTQTAVVSLILEDYLAKHGFWPPASSSTSTN